MIKDRLNERTLTPQEVRTILKTDNKEIVELCKKAAIRPRKNAKGHTYFSYDEVKNLRKVQAQVNGLVSNPIASKVPAAVGASSSVAGETLKQKIVDLNKEVYQLKNELNSYKPVALGFYKKKEVYVWE